MNSESPRRPLSFQVVRYSLQSRGTLNATSHRQAHPGALVRSQGGHACLHPWPELGDLSLEDELRSLAGGGTTPLGVSARLCLEIDGRARQENRWLFADLPAPPASHLTLTECCLDSLHRGVTLGFSHAKVKVSPSDLSILGPLLEKSPLPLRLDFNESLSRQQALDWCRSLSGRARANLDFLEDPCPYDPAAWEALRRSGGVSLALDRQAARGTTGLDILVHKPAVRTGDSLMAQLTRQPQPFLVTSYMDHPFGQLYAAYEAARLAARFPDLSLTAGLATHTLFDGLPSELSLGEGPHLQLPPGTGLGLDSYLDALPWTPWPD